MKARPEERATLKSVRFTSEFEALPRLGSRLGTATRPLSGSSGRSGRSSSERKRSASLFGAEDGRLGDTSSGGGHKGEIQVGTSLNSPVSPNSSEGPEVGSDPVSDSSSEPKIATVDERGFADEFTGVVISPKTMRLLPVLQSINPRSFNQDMGKTLTIKDGRFYLDDKPFDTRDFALISDREYSNFEGRTKAVMTLGGDLRVNPSKTGTAERSDGRVLPPSHPDVGNSNVATFAGNAGFEDGYLTTVGVYSGHYGTDNPFASSFLLELEHQGADLSKTMVYPLEYTTSNSWDETLHGYSVKATELPPLSVKEFVEKYPMF